MKIRWNWRKLSWGKLAVRTFLYGALVRLFAHLGGDHQGTPWEYFWATLAGLTLFWIVWGNFVEVGEPSKDDWEE